MKRTENLMRELFAYHPAQCGFELLGVHHLMQCLINQSLVTTFSGLGLEKFDYRTVQHD